MGEKKHTIILLILAMLFISQCSVFDDSEANSETHFQFLIFNEKEDVRTKQAKIGSILDDLWLRGILSLNKSSSGNIGIGIISNRIITTDYDLNIIDDINIPYQETSRSAWYNISRIKDTIKLKQAVSDSVVSRIEVERLNFNEPNFPEFRKVLTLESEGPHNNYFTEPRGFAYRNDFDTSKLYGHSIKYQLQEDSLGNKLFLTPYSYNLMEFEYSASANKFLIKNKLTNVPVIQAPLLRFSGILGGRFAFIIGYDDRIYLFDNKHERWDSISDRPLSNFVSENWHTAFTDSSFIFVSSQSLKSYNPYTQRIVTLHHFEESSQNAIVQYDKETGKILLSYFYDEVDGTVITNKFTTKCFTFEVRENMVKKEVFNSSFSKGNYAPVISNFIKINGSYFGIVSKHN
ncbi:MAG: hypothetical protein WD512_19710 [Candidatus Paceibacterota bacterium]